MMPTGWAVTPRGGLPVVGGECEEVGHFQERRSGWLGSRFGRAPSMCDHWGLADARPQPPIATLNLEML